uniref:Soluble scavenger receptor cysteine-rich domain-containing protein SSC5D n=1 Tax=Chelydra serpentina TaxID=8475 RepID=A0A8C3SLG8_CHESE
MHRNLSDYSLGVFADSALPYLAQVRLLNSPSRCAGRIEVLHNQQWGTVCDDGWNITDAGVVCRQLGCGTALSAPGGARFGQGTGPIWLDEVNCTGTESAISECRAKPWGNHNCHHGEDAGVVCSGNPPSSCPCECCEKQFGGSLGRSPLTMGPDPDAKGCSGAQQRLLSLQTPALPQGPRLCLRALLQGVVWGPQEGAALCQC